MQTAILIIIISTVCCPILFYILRKIYIHFTFWQRQNIKCVPFIPLGWAWMPVYKYMEYLNESYGKIYGIYKFESNILVVNDPKLVRELSIREFHKFPIRNSFHAGSGSVRKSLFLLEANEDWKRIRSIVTPAFTSGKLKQMISPIERITGNFIKHLRTHAQNGAEFDMKKYIGGFAMDVIACCGYGIELDSVSQPNHPIVVNAKKILNVDASISFMFCFMLPTIARFLRMEAFDKKAQDYFDELTFKIMEERTKNKELMKHNRDLLGLMMENECDEIKIGCKKAGITREEISGQGILFFIAGFDTTHATFDHVIYYISKYPEWQEKLFDELQNVKDDLTYTKLKELPILNAIIYETLRLRPPLLEIQREAKEDCTLLDTGIHVQKRTNVVFHPYIIHRNPEYFSDPNRFKPERFLNDKSLESNQAYMPFGVGPRLCVGMRFAQNELRIGLANLVLNYKITMDPAFKLEYFKGSILLSPKRLMVRISER